MAGIVLTPDDHRTLQEMLSWWKNSKGNTTNRPRSKLEVGTQPEVYIAKSPAGGIAAIGEVPSTGTGSADDSVPENCDIYRVVGSPGPYDLDKAGFTKLVHNVHPSPVLGDIWFPIARDKYGSWLALPSSGLSMAYAGQGTSADIPSGIMVPLVHGGGLSSSDVTWNPATPDRLTVVSSGYYLLGAHTVLVGTEVGAGVGNRAIAFQAGGSEVGLLTTVATVNDNNDEGLTTTTLWYLAAGDEIFLLFYQTSDSNRHTYGSLEGQLLYAIRMF